MGNNSKFTRRQFIGTCAFAAGSIACAGYCDSLFAQNNAGLWKWSKETEFYTKEANKRVICTLCPHECFISVDKAGDCRSRVNKNGKLYTIAYGNPCAVHIDPIEKKPFFHFMPQSKAFSIAAAGCNLRCLNCQNWEISQSSPYETSNYDLMPDAVVQEARKNGCQSIAYTYSEPLT